MKKIISRKEISIEELRAYLGHLDCGGFGTFDLSRIYSGPVNQHTHKMICIKENDLEDLLKTVQTFQNYLKELSDLTKNYGIKNNIGLTLDYISFGKYSINGKLEYKVPHITGSGANRFMLRADIEFETKTYHSYGPINLEFYKYILSDEGKWVYYPEVSSSRQDKIKSSNKTQTKKNG